MGETFEIRSVIPPAALASAVRSAVGEINRGLMVENIRTLADQMDSNLIQERLVARVSGFFGLVALLLAAMGLYGIMTYAVTRRTNEIGIRMALGAERGDVLWIVLRETLLLVSIGLAIGLPAALGATRLLESLLFELKPKDPATLALASAVLIAVAAPAGYLPARRAARIDPITALRYE